MAARRRYVLDEIFFPFKKLHRQCEWFFLHSPSHQQCGGHPGPWFIHFLFISPQMKPSAQSVSPKYPANAGVGPTTACAYKRLPTATLSISENFIPTLPSSED